MEVIFMALLYLGLMGTLIAAAVWRITRKNKKLLVSEKERWNGGKCLNCGESITVKKFYPNRNVKYKCIRCYTTALFTLPIKLLKDKDK
jgi:prepilin signal peptidase PulO-like enzyme (type II secretory pathway)